MNTKSWILVCYNKHTTQFWQHEYSFEGWTEVAMNATLYSCRRYARNALSILKERKQVPAGMRCAVRPVCQASNEKASE